MRKGRLSEEQMVGILREADQEPVCLGRNEAAEIILWPFCFSFWLRVASPLPSSWTPLS